MPNDNLLKMVAIRSTGRRSSPPRAARVWWAMPRQTEFMLCTLTDVGLSRGAFLEGLERFRGSSAYNDRLFAKRTMLARLGSLPTGPFARTRTCIASVARSPQANELATTAASP